MSEKSIPSERQAPMQSTGRSLVLVPDGTARPDALLSALASRGLCPELVIDEPSVMAGLASMDGERKVLIVVEPERWDRLGELICAVQTHHSEVMRWQYVDAADSGPRVSMLDGRFDGPRMNGQAHGVAGSGARVSDPVGQILGRRQRPVDALLVKVPGRPLSTREVITQQELTMLLGPVPGEAG